MFVRGRMVNVVFHPVHPGILSSLLPRRCIKSDAARADAFQVLGYSSEEKSTHYAMPSFGAVFGTSDRWSKDVETPGRDGSHENDQQVVAATSNAGTTNTTKTVADMDTVYWVNKSHKETLDGSSPWGGTKGNGHAYSCPFGWDA